MGNKSNTKKGKKRRSRKCCNRFLGNSGICAVCQKDHGAIEGAAPYVPAVRPEPINVATTPSNQPIGSFGRNSVSANFPASISVGVPGLSLNSAFAQECVDQVTPGPERRQCVNCKRHDHDSNGIPCFGVRIESVANEGLSHNSLMTRFPEKSDACPSYNLCEECSDLMRNPYESQAYKKLSWKTAWPAFMWRMFTMEGNADHGANMWAYVPLTWRRAWVDSFRGIRSEFSSMSLTVPEPFFNDITEDHAEFSEEMNSWKAKRVSRAMNKHCVPTVRCPWGCTEYIESTGNLSFGRFLFFVATFKLPVVETYFSYDKEWDGGISAKTLIGMRPDYLTFKDNVMNNSLWPVRPSIRVSAKGGATLCTCAFHKKGSSVEYIHVPRNPISGNRTSSESNNLASAVVQPRTFKNMKINNYNDSYKMVRIEGGFKGIDSCSLTFQRKFDRGNGLSFENEVLSVHGRTDVRSKLRSLVRQGEIPQADEDSILNEIARLNLDGNEGLSPRFNGGTSVSMDGAYELSMATAEEEMSTSHGFRSPWPVRLVNCGNSFRSKQVGPCFLPGFKHKQGERDCRLMWTLLSLMTRVPQVWKAMHEECVARQSRDRSERHWSGWCLKFAARQVLDNIKDMPCLKHPYSKSPSLRQLEWILHNPSADNFPTKSEAESCLPTFDWPMLLDYLATLDKAFVVTNGVFVDGHCEVPSEFDLFIIGCHDVHENQGRDINIPLVHTVGDSDDEGAETRDFELAYVVRDDSYAGEIGMSGLCSPRLVGSSHCTMWESSMKRGSEVVEFQVTSAPSKISISNVSLLVYVRKEKASDNMRNDYLAQLGNDCSCQCPLHDLHMITYPAQQRRFCRVVDGDGNKCPEEAVSQCVGREKCGHLTCIGHAAVPCPMHEERSVYIPVEVSKRCCAVVRGKKCNLLGSYECPEWRCNYFVCRKHRNEDNECLVAEAEESYFVDSTEGLAVAAHQHPPVRAQNDSSCVTDASNSSMPHAHYQDEDGYESDSSDHSLPWSVCSRESYKERSDEEKDRDSDSEDSGDRNQFMYGDQEEVMEYEGTEYEGDMFEDLGDNLVEDSSAAVRLLNVGLIESQVQCSPWNVGLSDQVLEPGLDPLLWSSIAAAPFEVDLTGKRVGVMWNKMNYCSLHTLFNKHMNLLVRSKCALKPNKAEQGFLQRLVATATGTSVPLLYPEGMLFPAIFWKDDENGTIDGAIPSGLWNKERYCHKYGFAGIEQHMRSRFMNTSLATSVNPEYMFFAFDAVNNAMSRGVDNRYVFRRGFEHMMGSSSVHIVQDDTAVGMDAIDSRRTVAQLAAMIREEEPTYFITHTCNQKQHFGLAPLRDWLDAECEKIKYDANMNSQDKEAYTRVLHEACSSLMTRGWMRAGKAFMDYIINSPEQPLGGIKQYWWRWEYQEANGNVPHIHCLLWTGEDKSIPEQLKKVQERVACSTNVYYDTETVSELMALGMLDNEDQIHQLVDDCRRINCHSCQKVNYRCHKRRGKGDGETVCRYKDYFLISSTPTAYTYYNCDPNHSCEAVDIMVQCGLMERNERGGPCNSHAKLRAGVHTYPAEPGEQLSPFSPTLFAWVRCSGNVQICDTYLSSRYLAKYVQGLDDNLKVEMKSDKGTGGAAMEEQEVTNMKITSGRIMEEARMKAKKVDKNSIGRAIGIPEVISLVLQIPQVHTNVKFLHIPTGSLESRGAVEVSKPFSRSANTVDLAGAVGHAIQAGEDRNHGLSIPNQDVRRCKEIPSDRMFTMLEETIIRDCMISIYPVDAITLFSVRPPELRFVNSPQQYLTFFVHGARTVDKDKARAFANNGLSTNVYNCMWINGLGQKVQIREAAIEKVLDLTGCRGEMRILFEGLLNCVTGNSVESLTMSLDIDNMDFIAPETPLGAQSGGVDDMSIGVDQDGTTSNIPGEGSYAGTARMNADSVEGLLNCDWQDDVLPEPCPWENSDRERIISCFVKSLVPGEHRLYSLPLPVLFPVQPSNYTKFMIHLVLSMGSFNNEAELYAGAGSCIALFLNAKLIESSEPTVEDVCRIVRRYVLEQLVFLPKGTYLFDMYLIEAFKGLSMMLLENVSSPFSCPPFLYTSLVEKASEEAAAYMDKARLNLATSLSRKPGAPPLEVLLGATKQNPVHWSPPTGAIPGQSDESHTEHRLANDFICKQVDDYVASRPSCRTATAIVGGPGVGKTFRIEMGGLYAMCQGLSVMFTSTVSDRANALGGIHIHKLFCLSRGDFRNIHRVADSAIGRLHKHGEMMHLLRTLDVLCIDELGNVSAEMLAVMSIIFQSIRGDATYMGGVLVFASLDIKQLRPVRGLPAIVSSAVMVAFNFLRLDKSVRALSDELLQEVLAIARADRLTNRDISRLMYIIEHHCLHVKDWYDHRIPPDAVRILGKHPGIKIAERIFYEQMKDLGKLIVARKSEDSQTSSALHGSWHEANAVSVNALNREAKEPERLKLLQGLVLQMTYNHAHGLFSNTQMAYMLNAPSQASLDRWEGIEVMLAPSGVRCLPNPTPTLADLLNSGWTAITVSPNPGDNNVKVQGTLRARRRQYPMRPCIAITIHSAQGSEYRKVVTSVNRGGHGEFKLWMREQVLVLISRTHRLEDLIFVGNAANTVQMLASLMKTKEAYHDYMIYIVNNLSIVTDTTNGQARSPVLHNPTNLRAIPMGVEVPPPSVNGYVYCLLSITNMQTIYIGCTKDLMKRLDQHQRGIGANGTIDTAYHKWHYLCFVSGFESRAAAYSFESSWHVRNQRTMDPQSVVEVGDHLMSSYGSRDMPLRMHMCLDFRYCD